MDDDAVGGCIFAIIVLWILGSILQGIANAVVSVTEIVFVNAIPIIVIVIVISLFIGALTTYEHTQKQKAEFNQRALVALKENQIQSNLSASAQSAMEHYTKIEREDQLARANVFKTVHKTYKAHIGLSSPDPYGIRHPEFHWKGAEIDGEIHIYKAVIGLLTSWRDLEDKNYSARRIAIRSLRKSGRFKHFDSRPGTTACYYIYWSVPFHGNRPALLVNGEVHEKFTRELLLQPHQLTTIPYTMHLKGRLRGAELTIPVAKDPLELEELELNRAERRAALNRRRQRLGLGEKSFDDPKALVGDAVERALKHARREDAIAKIAEAEISKINEDDSLSEDAKEIAIEQIIQRLQQQEDRPWHG